jgi:hypothetical protein
MKPLRGCGPSAGEWSVPLSRHLPLPGRSSCDTLRVGSRHLPHALRLGMTKTE